MELWKLEKRKDWPVIVTSVECSKCGAEVGKQCHFQGRPDLIRLDFHAERKHAAAEAFLAYQEKEKNPDGERPAEEV